MKMAALAAVLSTGIAACSSDDDSDNSVVTGSQEALDQACNDWKTARANWENTEAFLFGAADVYSIDPHTDTWPVAANDLADVLRDEKAMANLDNFIKTANAGILGYHGLEYVLFRQGLPRKIDQITNLEYNYICAVAKDLYHATATLEAAWDSKESNAERQRIAKEYVATHLAIDDDGNQEGALDGFQNFGKAFKNPGTGDWETALDATREIISGCQDIIGEVGDSKIGLPFTGEDKTYIESPYAYNSITAPARWPSTHWGSLTTHWAHSTRRWRSSRAMLPWRHNARSSMRTMWTTWLLLPIVHWPTMRRSSISRS